METATMAPTRSLLQACKLALLRLEGGDMREQRFNTNLANTLRAAIHNAECILGSCAPLVQKLEAAYRQDDDGDLYGKATSTNTRASASRGEISVLTDDNHDFEEWWTREGKFIDPDTSDVPWFDKRKGLCAHAYYYGKKLGQAQGLKATQRRAHSAIFVEEGAS